MFIVDTVPAHTLGCIVKSYDIWKHSNDHIYILFDWGLLIGTECFCSLFYRFFWYLFSLSYYANSVIFHYVTSYNLKARLPTEQYTKQDTYTIAWLLSNIDKSHHGDWCQCFSQVSNLDASQVAPIFVRLYISLENTSKIMKVPVIRFSVLNTNWCCGLGVYWKWFHVNTAFQIKYVRHPSYQLMQI